MPDAPERHLSDERERLLHDAHELQALIDGATQSCDTADVVDAGSAVAERDAAISQLVHVQQRILQIEAALDRAAAGAYGRCRECNEPISPERLEALPHTDVCISHAGR